MIADPNEGPQACSRCVHLGACPTPQACEQAEEERQGRRALRDVAIAAILLILYWRST